MNRSDSMYMMAAGTLKTTESRPSAPTVKHAAAAPTAMAANTHRSGYAAIDPAAMRLIAEKISTSGTEAKRNG
jgi:hypothetical protein